MAAQLDGQHVCFPMTADCSQQTHFTELATRCCVPMSIWFYIYSQMPILYCNGPQYFSIRNKVAKLGTQCSKTSNYDLVSGRASLGLVNLPRCL